MDAGLAPPEYARDVAPWYTGVFPLQGAVDEPVAADPSREALAARPGEVGASVEALT